MSAGPIRDPAVAGQFFPGTAPELEKAVTGYLTTATEPEKAIGTVMPHAGYIYSGAVAGETAASIKVPGTVIILGPNHTGLGPAVSVFPGGSWHMPFGNVPVNEGLADQILELTGSDSPKEHLSYEQVYGRPFDDLLQRVPDLTKVHRLIGYAAKVPLRETLQQIIQYEKQRST